VAENERRTRLVHATQVRAPEPARGRDVHSYVVRRIRSLEPGLPGTCAVTTQPS
jgi:hypothetical protein